MDASLAKTDFDAYLDGIKTFTRDTLRPNEHRLNDADGVPEEIVEKLRAYGLFGMAIPEEYGGLGLTMEQQVLVTMAVTEASACYRSRFSTTLGLSSQSILWNGTEDQRRKYLPKLATGELTGAFALTEEQAGSDAGGVQTSARLDAAAYVLNGSRRYITNANFADLFVVMARTSDTEKGAAGLSAFIVEKDTPGMICGAPDPKMGQDGAPIAEMRFEDCRVPVANLMGHVEGTGFRNAMSGINTARTHVAATCVGQAARLIEEALDYAVKREQFGHPIADFQSIQNMLADSRAEMKAARALVLDTARRFTQNPDSELRADISCAKYFATEMVSRVADRAVQILGGAGYMKAHDVERLYRDIRVFRIFEGASQVQQMIIARHMIGEEAGRAA